MQEAKEGTGGGMQSDGVKCLLQDSREIPKALDA